MLGRVTRPGCQLCLPAALAAPAAGDWLVLGSASCRACLMAVALAATSLRSARRSCNWRPAASRRWPPPVSSCTWDYNQHSRVG
jgi:hypothetical protein